jgi:hypothetical protein
MQNPGKRPSCKSACNEGYYGKDVNKEGELQECTGRNTEFNVIPLPSPEIIGYLDYHTFAGIHSTITAGFTGCTGRTLLDSNQGFSPGHIFNNALFRDHEHSVMLKAQGARRKA